jgi:lipopolysaccharide transport system permease protein
MGQGTPGTTEHADPQNARPVVVISARQPASYYWAEVWRFRELLGLLAWRDVLVRYKQTVFGIGWAVIRPFVTMIVFTVIFGRLAGLPSQEVPYPLLVLSGVLAWQFFATTFADASNSLVGNANMIAKVYFPRVIVPMSAVVGGMVDFVITLGLFGALALWYGWMPDWRLFFLPAYVALLFLFVFAASLWFSALNVTYRDFRYVVPFIIQLGAYVSPVGFSTTVVPEGWRLLYSINPMVAIIDGFRWSLLRGSSQPDLAGLALSVLVCVLLLVTGLLFFKRQERGFADVI